MTTPANEPSGAPLADPVSRLLEIGEPQAHRGGMGLGDDATWPDYAARFGIGIEHVDDLIHLACDAALNASSERSAEVWGPLHAWRALGQLRAATATVPLLALAQAQEIDDWIGAELPTVFGMIGEAAIRPIADFIADPATSRSAGGTAMDGLTEIAQQHPECRADCIAVIEQTLRRRDDEDIDINASAVAAVLELEAVEAIEAVRDAFRRDAVDLSMAGDIEDVEIHLGLREHRETPRPRLRSPHLETLQRLRSLAPARTATPKPEKRRKVGRNDPCPCGSGRKYKKCCGSATNNGPAPV